MKWKYSSFTFGYQLVTAVLKCFKMFSFLFLSYLFFSFLYDCLVRETDSVRKLTGCIIRTNDMWGNAIRYEGSGERRKEGTNSNVHHYKWTSYQFISWTPMQLSSYLTLPHLRGIVRGCVDPYDQRLLPIFYSDAIKSEIQCTTQSNSCHAQFNVNSHQEQSTSIRSTLFNCAFQAHEQIEVFIPWS